MGAIWQSPAILLHQRNKGVAKQFLLPLVFRCQTTITTTHGRDTEFKRPAQDIYISKKNPYESGYTIWISRQLHFMIDLGCVLKNKPYSHRVSGFADMDSSSFISFFFYLRELHYSLQTYRHWFDGFTVKSKHPKYTDLQPYLPALGNTDTLMLLKKLLKDLIKVRCCVLRKLFLMLWVWFVL